MEGDAFQLFNRDLSDARYEQYRRCGALAIDTETMGLLPARDRLCLVQICDPDDRVTVVRIERGQTTAPNLQRLLEDPAILKIFHFARFDIATLQYHLGIGVTPIFCTKVASKLARTYTSKHGLKDLILELECVELDKSAQSSDWGNVMQLSAEQLQYAANDVRYLISASQRLQQMLEREERWDLAQRCFQCLPTIAELDILQYSSLFEH